MSSFSAQQLICYLPSNTLSDTTIAEYNTTAGPNGEMAEGEVIRYVDLEFLLVFNFSSEVKYDVCSLLSFYLNVTDVYHIWMMLCKHLKLYVPFL